MLGSVRQPTVGAPIRVLLVLGKRIYVELIKLTLSHGRYVVDVAPSAPAAVVRLQLSQPHLVILDMDLDGQRVMQHIQASNARGGRVLVLSLTRRGDLKTKLAAFDAGADDIPTMPFSPEELLARVIALVRRSYEANVTFTPTIKLGGLEIDIFNRIVRAGSAALHLTSLEQSLLYLLAANAGSVVTREEILDTLFGVDYVVESHVVDRLIRNLRGRLQHDPGQPLTIATVPRRGYRFLLTPAVKEAQAVPKHAETHSGSRRHGLSRTAVRSRRERPLRQRIDLALTRARNDPEYAAGLLAHPSPTLRIEDSGYTSL